MNIVLVSSIYTSWFLFPKQCLHCKGSHGVAKGLGWFPSALTLLPSIFPYFLHIKIDVTIKTHSKIDILRELLQKP